LCKFSLNLVRLRPRRSPRPTGPARPAGP
jgi:hypothetical protein